MPRALTLSRAALRLLAVLAAVAAAAAHAPAGRASQFIERNASDVRFSLNGSGDALVTYFAQGRLKHVILNGDAINALPPSAGRKQVRFGVRYLNPSFPRLWAPFTVACGRYDGPPLAFLVASCKAPDGSYWAAQAWPTPSPDLGFAPWTETQKELWLDVSHWRGPLARLVVYQGWKYGQTYRSLFGKYTYAGAPVYGFGTTSTGAPTDGFGRLLYLDTFDSAYGPGWRRENSFVSHNPSGAFCYGFYPFDPTRGGYAYPPRWQAGVVRGPGIGSRYRIVAVGPGVTPDVVWEDTAIGAFDPDNPADVIRDFQAEHIELGLGSKLCASEGLAYAGARSWLGALRDDFAGPPGEAWSPPNATGGATVTAANPGLTFSLPQGAPSSVSLRSSAPWVAYRRPAFLDLGPGGIPSGAGFAMTFRKWLPSAPGQADTRYLGLRIAGGTLAVVQRTMCDAGGRCSDRGYERLDAATAYDPVAMRWLFMRALPNATAQFFYAARAAGPWTLHATVPLRYNVDPALLQLDAASDGTSPVVLTLHSLPGVP